MRSGEGNTRTIIGADALARITLAIVLMAAALAAPAITSLLGPHGRAVAQSHAVIEPAPTMATVPPSVPRDSGEVGPFAFGFLVFDWDPRAPGGVPGFDAWVPTVRP
jgi:hypothetical protein